VYKTAHAVTLALRAKAGLPRVTAQSRASLWGRLAVALRIADMETKDHVQPVERGAVEP